MKFFTPPSWTRSKLSFELNLGIDTLKLKLEAGIGNTVLCLLLPFFHQNILFKGVPPGALPGDNCVGLPPVACRGAFVTTNSSKISVWDIETVSAAVGPNMPP
jgi:hypothetical protein